MSAIGDDGGNSTASEAGSDVDRLQAENEALRSRLTRRLALRKWLAILLVVLTTITVIGAAVSFWVHQTVFDSDQFMETVEPALEEPAFYTAISDKVSGQIIAALDIEPKVTAALTDVDEYLSQVREELLDNLEMSERGTEILSRLERPSVVGLVGPVTDWIESRVRLRTEAFITSDEFKSRFPVIVRRVHEASVALVRNELAELPNVYTEGGEVRLNLIPIIAEALRGVADEIRDFLPDINLPDVVSDRVDEGREQLAAAVDARLPEDFGQVTIMSEDSLGEIQTTVSRLDRFVWVLVILAVLLAALTIGVSTNRRRTAMQLAIGVILGFVLAAAVLRRLESALVAEIASPEGGQAARVLLGEVLGGLRTVALIVGGVALVVAIGSYLAGQPAWLNRASEGAKRLTTPGPEGSAFDRWVTAHADLLRVAGVVIAVGVLFLTGLDLITVIVVGILLALYLWVISSSSTRLPALGEPVAPVADVSDGVKGS